MNFNYNSWNTDPDDPCFAGKIPFGACPAGSKILIRTYADFSAVDSCMINFSCIFGDISLKESMQADPSDSHYYLCHITLPEKPGLFWYRFEIQDGSQHYLYIPKNDDWGGQGKLMAVPETPAFNLGATDLSIPIIPKDMWQITVYQSERHIPDWYTNGIMYQIFPDRFACGSHYQPKYFPNAMLHANWNDVPHYDRNPDNSIDHWDFFGGNLEGIIEKLDYLQSLHIAVLYLNPIFEARSNHKYDTADYKKISPEFGDETIFKILCNEAKKRGIHIILDGVFSHTGDDSLYFNRYGHYPETGAWQSENSPYNWYRFENYPEKYECWWGVTSMPNVEEMTPAYQNYIFNDDNSVIRRWLRAGASGFRLDVADELPDAFIANLKTAMNEEKEDAVLIGEVWEDASRKIAYNELRQYFWGNELDAVMNYPFRNILINFMSGKTGSDESTCLLMALYEHYPRKNFMASMNLIGSHDRPRILTLLSGFESPEQDQEKEHFSLDKKHLALAKDRLKLTALIQMTFPGVPCIYYGDEAGCQGWEDPYNRGTYPWGNEDPDLITWYKKITGLRSRYPVFYQGDFIPYFTHNEDLFAYCRTDNHTRCFCIFNRSLTQTYPLPEGAVKNNDFDLLQNRSIDLATAVIAPLSAYILTKK